MELEDLKSKIWYDPVVGVFVRKNNGAFINTVNKDGYRVGTYNKRNYFLHRLAWFYFYGEWPEGQIDHINKIKSDNRISNLRKCSVAQNLANRPCFSSSVTGFKGVSKTVYGRYRARIRINGVNTALGNYDTPEEASGVYMEKLKELYGEFASY